ncbi:cysteine desulfurase family protein [Oscillatoria sp. CS-180]|uniref:cysteine desulfurase family protein n=1 Tax=Oscillatoria sp. CS-180 TaxID=3021720 RepID=UPI00232EACB1|nr:cysteine desulfurase family protein [Oscillatoria sp. CS-180]MDB9528390.1 cysteine desulfurase family protein [Oscillatoria sp. CS-180]
MQIYLDYSATTPTRPEAIALMQTVMQEQWGNPSSLHQWGNRAAVVLERSRAQVAGLLNAPADSIVFTAGGTEANNLAVMGVARQYQTPQHLIVSSVEHSAIAEPARYLASIGWQVTWLPVDHTGRVDPDALAQAIRPNTVLVSIIYGQSEVGTLQPIPDLAAITRSRGVLFHTDAVQVVGRLPLDMQTLPVDLLSISSQKFYGPQGSGALYIRPGTDLMPLLGGGGQEMGLRSGTQALPNIAGFGLAAELATGEMPCETIRLIQLRDRLFHQLADVPGLEVTGDPRDRLPHHASFCLTHANGVDITGKAVVRQMTLAGIGISAGASCRSGKLSPSPVLQAMGYGDRAATGGIRLTLGKHTTAADVDWTAMVLRQILDRMLSPLTPAHMS